MSIKAEDVLNFWFYEVSQNDWFTEDTALDQKMHDKFLAIHEDASNGKLNSWENTPEGLLALVLLLDIFAHRMFRNTPRAFDTDILALNYAREAIIRHFDDRIDRQFKLFFYLPFLNSESIGDQRLALFYIRERTKEESWLTIAERNFDIVQRFGRFPQRNPILGREATPEESAFLDQIRARSNQVHH